MGITHQVGDPDLKRPAIRAERGACADCPVYEKCLFHMPRYGGFKNQGPRNVVYALITDKVENTTPRKNASRARTSSRRCRTACCRVVLPLMKAGRVPSGCACCSTA